MGEKFVKPQIHSFEILCWIEQKAKKLLEIWNDFFYLLGESYAGHYVPAISHYIWEMNKVADEDSKIPLKGLAIGNGLTNTEIQYAAYPDMALDGGKSQGGSLAEGVITNQWGK